MTVPRPHLHHRKERTRKHRRIAFYLLAVNAGLACMWGPVFILLTVLGPARHLSSQVVWVAIISYYANMMGNIATAAGLYSSMVAHNAHEMSVDNAEDIREIGRVTGAR